VGRPYHRFYSSLGSHTKLVGQEEVWSKGMAKESLGTQSVDQLSHCYRSVASVGFEKGCKTRGTQQWTGQELCLLL
jgi:hypothetical protein